MSNFTSKPSMWTSSSQRHGAVLRTAFLFSIIFLLLAARRPDILTNPQPWAEDGAFWLAEAYQQGFWSTLFEPKNGYFQTISRITYGFALLFGISKAALVANIIAITLRTALILFILSKRLHSINLIYRIAAAAYLILAPNLAEGYINITNIHWYLGIYMVAILIAQPLDSKAWIIHDILVFLISGLSGPFIVFILAALAIKKLHLHTNFRDLVRNIDGIDLIALACSVIQIFTILSSADQTRSTAPLGASSVLLAQIFHQRIFIGTFLEGIPFVPTYPIPLSIATFALFAISMAWAVYRGGWRYQAAASFPILLIGFALAKPQISLTDPQWPLLLIPHAAERYFFVTNFSFFLHLIFIIDHLQKFRRIVLFIFLIFSLIIFLFNFRISSVPEVGFHEAIRDFEQSPPGTITHIPIPPAGWFMTLVR